MENKIIEKQPFYIPGRLACPISKEAEYKIVEKEIHGQLTKVKVYPYLGPRKPDKRIPVYTSWLAPFHKKAQAKPDEQQKRDVLYNLDLDYAGAV